MQWLKGKKNRPVIFYPLSENKNKIIDPVDDSVTFRRALDTDTHIRHVNSERRLVFKRPTFATSECFVVKSGHRAAARKFLLVSPWRGVWNSTLSIRFLSWPASAPVSRSSTTENGMKD